MKLGARMAAFSTGHPKAIVGVMAVLAVTIGSLAAIPSLIPGALGPLQGVQVDTDPENMLGHDEPVRVFHDTMKKTLSLHDMVVVGVVDDTNPEGVFTAATLGRIYGLTQYAMTLRGAAIGSDDPNAGVVEIDVIAPSTVDNIEQGGLGTVRFEWLMPSPPATDAEALTIREKAQRLPFLNGTLVSEDGKAIALYLPLTSKDLSYAVYTRLNAYLAEHGGSEEYHITGLPVAEDTFGVEMFIQMAISAPLAMLVIFIILLIFFRKLPLIVSPLILAFVTVIYTMGLLIVSGQTIHIMSSMIPIFIMPIAVLDSVHILSEFFDRYQKTRDRKRTICHVMEELFSPMLFTSLTSTAGFASLALTPIPPVQVFGIFVAFGIMAAWALTMTFIPAYIMLIPNRWLDNFGAVHHEDAEAQHAAHGLTGKALAVMARFSYGQAKLVVALALMAVGVAAYGIAQIQINDNPMRWFRASHPIRVADRVLNEHFGGTYMAYLAFRAEDSTEGVASYANGFASRLAAYVEEAADGTPEIRDVLPPFQAEVDRLSSTVSTPDALIAGLATYASEQLDSADGKAAYGWDELSAFVDRERQRSEVFKDPAVLRYMEDLQGYLATLGVVGKSNSLADVVKTVHRELFEGAPEQFTIPDSSRGVAQCLITYESSHRPQDLFHFVTPDYRQSSMWLQLKSGDNKDMVHLVDSVAAYVAEHPLPEGLAYDWFGLTYINVVWQDKMVAGMLQAFMGSFLVVLLMMVFLFQSGLWALLSMIPLTITIGLIYGVIGLIGKDYDMPVAVLSSMTLGLAVDFAIHFLARARAMYTPEAGWKKTHDAMFGEPARAITRNVLVIAIGFLPLLAAPLVPYNTVGVFLAAILGVSGAGTLLLLPALVRLLERRLFDPSRSASIWGQFDTLFVGSVTLVALVALNVEQLTAMPGGPLFMAVLVATPILAVTSWAIAKRHTGPKSAEKGA